MKLLNPHGAIVGVSDDKVEQLLEQGFRIPDPSEMGYYNAINLKNPDIDLHFVGFPDKKDGYGQSNKTLVGTLARSGVRLTREYRDQPISFIYGTPVLTQYAKAPYKILYTMFESDRIPNEWSQYLDDVDQIITPSKFCQKTFASCGYDSIVSPLGYNNSLYRYINRPERSTFTFLHFDAFNIRKGFDLVFKAFNELFADNQQVRLILKTISKRTPFPIQKSQYPNIEVIKEDYTDNQMVDLFERSDCFVFPSRGEGFGLPPLEAMATGLPTIFTNGHALAEYFDADCMYGVDVEKKIPAIYKQYKDAGQMLEPSYESLKKQMLHIYNTRGKAAQMGRKAAALVSKNYTIDKAGQKLRKVIKSTQKTKKLTKPIDDFAFIMENIDFYSGGRYYNWMQSLMLQELGYKTTIYTNKRPIFDRDFQQYKQPNIELVDMHNLDVKAKNYFGSPELGVKKAMELAAKHKRPAYISMFDPPHAMMESEVVRGYEMRRHNQTKDLIQAIGGKIPSLKMIVLTKYGAKDFKKWYGLDNIYHHYPAVNSRIADLFKTNKKRNNWIVSVSRNDVRKSWKQVVDVFQPISHEYELHIISYKNDGLLRYAAGSGVDPKHIHFHDSISDLEKFQLISQSKAILSCSHFEGFGIWMIEGRYMGVPIVMYDLPHRREVYDDQHMYTAEVGNVVGLQDELKKALNKSPIRTSRDYAFTHAASALQSIIND